ncbi:MAG: tetratricopeptide repeat protein [Gammaproteobacteria bacterium]|nr:tetratricopeptide repeat protein [Gammaproteobacteria bacterium]
MSGSGNFGTVGTLLLALSACQTPVGLHDGLPPESELLSGKAIFGEEVSSSELPDLDIVATSDAMRAFVADVRDVPNEAIRFDRLLDRMRAGGYVPSGYDPYVNLTAREAFAEKRGNCLSYTNLFIALARETGLDARYQVVDVPPDYDSINDMVVLIRHVNARVEHIPGRGAVSVEFSGEYASGIHDRRVVDDRFALGLHYNNLAFSGDRAANDRSAFVYLRKAIEQAPEHPDFWTNLGVLYARGGHFEQAIASYRRALGRDSNHRGAIRGLANAYGALGKAATAQFYQRRMAHSRTRDAYAYYTLARRAYLAEAPGESLELVSRAIRLHRRDHRFHLLAGELHTRLGDTVAANESFKRAGQVARSNASRTRHRLERHYPRATVYSLHHL